MTESNTKSKTWDCQSGTYGQRFRARMRDDPNGAPIVECGVYSAWGRPDSWLRRPQLRELIEHLQAIEAEMIARETGHE